MRTIVLVKRESLRTALDAVQVKRTSIRTVIIALPLVCCNSVAVTAQYEYFRTALQHWGPLGALGMSVSLESLALFLSLMSFESLVAGDSAFRLRIASYLLGFIIGTLNYSHFAAHWHPNAEAISVGLLSSISPWIWGIFTRRNARDALMASGAIEPHAVRLGANRWTLHTVKSFRVFRHAVWNNPGATATEAIRAYEAQSSAAALAVRTRQRTASDPDSQHIRQWARASGLAVNGRGRIPAELRAAWTQAGKPAMTVDHKALGNGRVNA